MKENSEIVKKICADPFARFLGARFLEIAPGHAVVEMDIRENLCNFHGTAHGGAIFALADIAFSAASNAGGTPAVALNVSINYLKAVFSGSTLRAVAQEESQGWRTRLYRIHVLDENKNLVAVFEGLVYRKTELG
jgi:acyl-CoA thioesterase